MKKMMDSTTVIITTTDNRVLLQKRDENPDIEYPGYYSLVSGYLEEEETPLDGIIRELKEEFQTLIHIQQDKRFTFQNTDIRCIVHQISMMNIFPPIIVCPILRPQIGYRTKMHLLGFLVFKFFLQFSDNTV